MPSRPGAKPRLDKLCQALRLDHLVILQCNANVVLHEVAELKTFLASQQVDVVSCIQETKSCQTTKPLKSLNIGQLVAGAQFKGGKG